MTSSVSPLQCSLEVVSHELGSVLRILFEEERKKRPVAIPFQTLLREMPGEPDTQEAELVGALAILRGLGLISMDAQGKVQGVSKHARFALGSLGKFLSASVPVADERVDDRERNYLISLTKSLESAREADIRVDNEPLHSRRIVNALVKSRQKRHWKVQDVYLHVYHPDWKEYHLVGLSHKDDSRSDEEIIQLALQQQVELRPDQYVLDPTFKPPDVIDRRISATSGALTEYTYTLMAVKKARVRLGLQDLIEEGKFSRDWFRWFTWEEIKRRESEQGEPIMFGIPTIMDKEDLNAIPIEAASADDVRAGIRIDKELGNRFTYMQLLAFATILILLLLIQSLPYMLPWLGHPDPRWAKAADIAQIIGTLMTVGGVLVGLLKSQK